MRALLMSFFLLAAAQQDETVHGLIKKLGSSDFEEQGRAAKALEALGPKALPALREAAENGAGDVRTWAQRIVARLQEGENRIRALVAKLGSADDEEKDAAEAELSKIGSPVIEYLGEALKSDNKNLRRRAEKLIAEIGEATAAKNTRFAGRLGGKRNLVVRGGGGVDTEDAVLAALKWLSRHPSADGSWKTKDCGKECKKIAKYGGGDACAPNPGYEDYDAGNTGLAVLAFLGSGYSHLSKDTYDGIVFGDVVRKGLQWIMSHQDPDGCIGSRETQKYMYGHAICALALVEAYGLTGSNLFKDQARKAVDFTVAAQNPGKGWRYSSKCGDNDTSVTGWCVSGLRSAELSGLKVPRAAYDAARAWLDEVTEDAFARVGYTHKGTGKVFIPGLNENFNHHETLTAMGVLARIQMDRMKGDGRLTNGCDLLLRDKPKWDTNAIDFYYWHQASQALFQFDGPAGAKWKAWNEDLKTALVKNQNTGAAGCKSGSWEPVDRWSGEGGRVYATAINALTLETYYRHDPAFGEK